MKAMLIQKEECFKNLPFWTRTSVKTLSPEVRY